MTTPAPEDFAARALDWFERHGRHDLPWQHPRTPYRVWLSEIMLQQTQVATVVPYFARFLAAFPSVDALAAATQDEVLAQWSGLGYYSRARNLHRAAQEIVAAGGFPRSVEAWSALPGIGASTAGAIVSQAYDQPASILDGNVRRLLARHAGVEGWPGAPAVQRRLWQVAEARLPAQRGADYAQALMDLGATVCLPRGPRCPDCPLRADCVAHATARVETLPAPRPRRARPRRECPMLVLRDGDGRVWFEQRPPSGVWACLWCLPLLAPGEDARAWCAQRGCEARAEGVAHAPIRHELTHLSLVLTPVLLEVAPGAAGPGDGRWLTMAESARLALPAPVRRFVDSLAGEARGGTDGPMREARPRGRGPGKAADAR